MNKPLSKKLFDDALFISVVSAAAILFMYKYKSGYYDYFKLTSFQIKLGIPDYIRLFEKVFTFLVILAIGDLFISLFVSSCVEKYTDENIITAQRKNYAFIVMTFITFAFCLVFPDSPALIIAGAALFLFTIIVFLVTHFRRNKASHANELKSLEKEVTEREAQDNFSFFAKYLGKGLLIVLFLVVITANEFESAGLREAQARTEYFSINGRTDLIGIDYTEQMIVAKNINDGVATGTVLIPIDYQIEIQKQDLSFFSASEIVFEY